MLKIKCWFNNYSTGKIGVLEKKGDRMLIQDDSKISAIEYNVKKFLV